MVRVLLHCCLAEKSWNPYYGLLALKLARGSKAHRMTMQACVRWVDVGKEVPKQIKTF